MPDPWDRPPFPGRGNSQRTLYEAIGGAFAHLYSTFLTGWPFAAPPKDEKPKVWAADIQITPNGKFLYATERTTNKIALFTVAPGTGKLAYVANFATEAQPRGIRIDPTGQFLVASGEKSDRISVYKIDKSTGKLGEPSRHPVGNGANW